MEFEDILEKVGGFGRFQKVLLCAFIIPLAFLMSWVWISIVFTTSTPEHWCRVPDVAGLSSDVAGLSAEQRRTLVSASHDPSCEMRDLNYSSLLLDAIPLSNDSHSVPCRDGWEFDKSKWHTTLATKWELVCGRSHYTSLLISLQSAGGVIGTSLFGALSDRFGRKKIFFVLLAWAAITDITSTLVDDFRIFGALRFMYGMVFPILFTLCYILIVEIVSPSKRARVNGVMNVVWSLGICTMPLVAFLSTDWTTLVYINCCICTLLLFALRFVPESPSWLVSRGRYEEAAQIMMRIGETNNQSQKAETLFAELKDLGERNKKKNEANRHTSYTAVFKYPRLRRHFFILTFCWTANGMAYLGLTFNTRNLSGNEYLNFFAVSAVEAPGCMLFWLAMDRLGRRWTATAGFLLLAIACLLPVCADVAMMAVVGSVLGKLVVSGNFMVTDQQGGELFPTEARSFCMGMSGTISKSLTFLAPYLAYLSVYGRLIPFASISGVCVLGAVLAAFLPETLGQRLPQTAHDANQMGSGQPFCSWIRKKKSSDCNPKLHPIDSNS